MAERVNSDNFDSRVLQAQGLVLAEFYSDSCVPCKRMSPVLSALESEEGLDVVKVNIGYDRDLAQRYDVTATPTLALFKDGQLADKVVGAKKKDELKAFVDAHK
jgi:thioredoxin 1